MTTPKDLLALAIELLSGPTDAHARAAVSRSYYAAFHHLRDIAEDRVGLPHFGTADDHRELHAALRALDEAGAQEFNVLRRLRVLSDYDLSANVPAEQPQLSVAIAASLLDWS